jgi:hypothetical protein
MHHEPSREGPEQAPTPLDLSGSRGVIVGDHGRITNVFRTIIRVYLGFGRAREPGRLTPHERRQADQNLQRLSEAMERNDFAVLAVATGPALLPFTLTDMPCLVANPDRARAQPGGGPLPPGTTVESRFNAASKRLLIVAPVGAGKSTALLLLARHLWLAATVEGPGVRQLIRNRRVPVILRLSRWTDNRSLTQWMADELTAIYDIDQRVARILITHGMVIPMLDGLDEVTAARRPDCVREINDYTDLNGGPPPLAVTCRSDDYDRTDPLRLGGAVLIEPLTDQQVREQLAALPGTEPLLAAYSEDDALRDLLRTPLFLHLLVSVAGKEPGATTLGLTAEQIVANYVTGLFGHRPVERRADRPRFPDTKLREWLSAMAVLLGPHGTLFIPDELDSAVLREAGHRARLDRGLPLLVGVLSGLGVTAGVLTAINLPWTLASYLYSFVVGAAAGAAIGLSSRRPRPAGQRLVWSWSRAFEWLSTPSSAVTAGIVALGLLGLAWWQDGTVGYTPAFILLAAALATARGLTTTVGGSMSPAPERALQESRRNALRVWAAALASIGALAVVIVAINAIAFRFVSVALLVGIDAAVLVWTFGALLAGVVCGLAVLGAPSAGGRVRDVHRRPARRAKPAARAAWRIRDLARRWSTVTKPAVVLLAVPAGIALDLGLQALLAPVTLHWWLGNALVIAVVLALSWLAVRAGTRQRALARPLGTFVASFCLTLILRLLQPVTDRNQTMYLVVTLLLAICAALVLHGGGLAWARQHGIRIMLDREGTMPRDLPGFLDDAENRGLLRRFGRGYTFPHEIVREYFTGHHARVR